MRPFLLVIGVLLFPIGHIWAQNHPGRLWLDAGFGMARVHTTCQAGCYPGSSSGAGLLLGAGLTLSRSWRVGLEGSTAVRQNFSDRVSSMALAVYHAPIRDQGWFLKGGAGLSFYHDASHQQGQGSILMTGAGYRLRLSPGLAVGPTLTVSWNRQDEIRFSRVITGRAYSTIACILSLGVTFY